MMVENFKVHDLGIQKIAAIVNEMDEQQAMWLEENRYRRNTHEDIYK